MASSVHFMTFSQNIDQIKPKFWFLSKSLFVEPWYGELISATFGVYPMGISAWEVAGDEILGLWASFWLCFWVNHKEIQNTIFHGMVADAQQSDLLLKSLSGAFTPSLHNSCQEGREGKEKYPFWWNALRFSLRLLPFFNACTKKGYIHYSIIDLFSRTYD